MFFNQRPPLLDRSCHIHSAVKEASRVLGTRTPRERRASAERWPPQPCVMQRDQVRRNDITRRARPGAAVCEATCFCS